MTVKRFNNAYGTITDNPLSDTATTINSAELDRLGAIATTDEFARVTLDPGRDNGEPEIIHVTDYDGSAGSATIERGKEGTTAREHPSGTTWEHGPTAEDVNAGDASGTDTVAVGSTADGSQANSVVAGQGTSVGGSSSVIIGRSAEGTGSSATVVGRSATSPADGVAIGPSASAGSSGAVAIGRLADAGGSSVAIGKDATCSGQGSVAVGINSSVSHSTSVAIGTSVSSTADDQVKFGGFGGIHLAMDVTTDPTTPPTDEGRLYFRDDGSGTIELVALFPSGNSTVLATGAP